MPRFFCDSDSIVDEAITISGEDAHHMIRVLRVKIGEKITVCDKCGMDYFCKVDLISDTVTLRILSNKPNQSEPKAHVTLYQGIPKGDKMEFIIQKAVELGVTKIVPMSTKFCVAKDLKQSKIERYNKIAAEAAKQSGRGIIPLVAQPITFAQAIKNHDGMGVLYYENGGVVTHEIVTPTSGDITVYIGSEGGFCPDEVNEAGLADIQIATLGKRILRCETAPMVALTLVMHALGEL